MEKEIYIKKGWLFIPVCATYGELPFGGKKNNRMLSYDCFVCFLFLNPRVLL